MSSVDTIGSVCMAEELKDDERTCCCQKCQLEEEKK